jgi:hypothetical protein
MDFVKIHFKNITILENYFSQRQGKGLISLEETFTLVDTYGDISNIFNSHLTWSVCYINLGFKDSSDLRKIHHKWHIMVERCRENKGSIYFRRKNPKLEINFE